ncbi:MAG: prepilin-type N-terminal cleavage/methylation domain-containing protein [Verrucomicrobiales bacterium]
MTAHRTRQAAFSLLELLMAMALFTIAAVSLAEALNVISLTVSESAEDAEIREQLRSVLLEVTRDPDLQPETRSTNPNDQGIFFEIEVTLLSQENERGETLENLHEVVVKAIRRGPAGHHEELDWAGTYVYPPIF